MENKDTHLNNNDSTLITDHLLDEKTIDAKIFDNLRELMGDDFVELLNIFLDSAPKQIAALKESANTEDADSAFRTAHSLKSSSGNLGALALYKLCKDLELKTRKGKIEGSIEAINKIETEFIRVKEVFETEIEKTAYSARHQGQDH